MARNSFSHPKAIWDDAHFRVIQTIRTVRDSNHIKLGTIQQVINPKDGSSVFYAHKGRYTLGDELIDSCITISKPSLDTAKSCFRR